MKLSSRLFSDLVPGVPSGPKVGDRVSLKDGVYRLEAKLTVGDATRVRLVSTSGKVASMNLKDLRPMDAISNRIASFVQLAFNKDFDEYVKTLVRDAGFPVDEEMNWSKWFEYKVRGEIGWAPEELRDEGVHNLIIWALVEKKVLDLFNPSKLKGDLINKPLEKQITAYLIRIFNDRMDYVRNYVRKSTGEGKEFSGEGDEELELPGLDRFEGDLGTPEDLYEEVSQDASFKSFQSAFFKWLDSGGSGLQERSVTPIKVLFDLVILAEDPKPRFIVDNFSETAKVSPSSLKGYIKKLADSLIQFSQSAPKGIVNEALVEKLESLSSKKQSLESNVR